MFEGPSIKIYQCVKDDIDLHFGLVNITFHTLINLETSMVRVIKHDFPFINIRKVPREVLKTKGEARGFQPSRGTLRMLMNDKSCLIAIIA